MCKKSYTLIAMCIASVLTGCASTPKMNPNAQLVSLAPSCDADLNHDYGLIREDPKSTFALQQAGVIAGAGASGAVAAVAGVAAMPLVLIPVLLANNASVNKEESRYSGIIFRRTVSKVLDGDEHSWAFGRMWGVAEMPSDELLRKYLSLVLFEEGGAAYAQHSLDLHPGDIVDIKTVYGRHAEQRPIWSSYSFGKSDFNAHPLRVIRVVCKGTDKECTAHLPNQITGILCRHQETAFLAQDYLIPSFSPKVQATAVSTQTATPITNEHVFSSAKEINKSTEIQ